MGVIKKLPAVKRPTGLKLHYNDTETTGLNPKRNEVVQIASIIDINGIAVEEINIKMRPSDPRRPRA